MLSRQLDNATWRPGARSSALNRSFRRVCASTQSHVCARVLTPPSSLPHHHQQQRQHTYSTAPHSTRIAALRKRDLGRPIGVTATVAVDNAADPLHTVLRVEADDFPGLLRVLAWSLNGLGLSVANALIRTEGGVASDVFFITDTRGRKLSDTAAADVAERLQGIVDDVCAGGDATRDFTAAAVDNGAFFLSNESHPTCTELTVLADAPGLLLDLASVIHGMGVSIEEGVIRSSGRLVAAGTRHLKDDPIAALAEPPAGRRAMRFYLTSPATGGQLDYATASGLLYALQLVTGRSAPTRLPAISA